jgi:catechol 2,3-dioxygenase-like lactoylglutathione lyase family enzyme
MLALVPTADTPDLRETGVHQAYRVSPVERDVIGARLAAKGAAAFTYKEDRPAEENDNFYVFDPSGNRVQLVAVKNAPGSGILGIDHAAVQVADMLWTEKFYGEDLGLAVDHRVGWQTADYARARKWAAGEENMAPGTRRLDQRYTVMVNRKTVPRCNMQLFFRTGDAILGIFLANKHFQEPPEEQAIGTPRVALTASRDELARAAKLIAATGKAVEGPVIHPQSSVLEASVYFRDPGGNFVELCTPRRR